MGNMCVCVSTSLLVILDTFLVRLAQRTVPKQTIIVTCTKIWGRQTLRLELPSKYHIAGKMCNFCQTIGPEIISVIMKCANSTSL